MVGRDKIIQINAEVIDKYISEYLKNAASLIDHDIAKYVIQKNIKYS